MSRIRSEEYKDKKISYQKNRKEWIREKAYIRMYGITLEDYTKKLIGQGGVCAICKLPEISVDKRTGNLRNLAVDHCHTTGKVRGLLCSNCNMAIGKFKDSILLIETAVSYLKEY